MPRKPAAQATVNSETMAYLHCWRKAHEDGELSIPCLDRTEAERTKFLLYRVAKQLYANPQLATEYPQFVRARRNCSVRCELVTPDIAERARINPQEFPWRVLVYRSDRKHEVRKLVDRLGLSDADLQVPMTESEKQILQGISVQVPAMPIAAPSQDLMMATQEGATAQAAIGECAPDRLPAGMAAYFEREEQ